MKKNTFKTKYEELMYKSNNPDPRDEDEGFQLASVLISFVVLAVFMAAAFFILYIIS